MPACAARWAVAATVVAPSPTGGRDHREVADARLGHVGGLGDPAQRGIVEADPGDAGDDGDRGRHGAGRTHGLLDLAGDPLVVRSG